MAESFDRLRDEFLAESEETLEKLQRDLNRLGESVGAGAPPAEIVDRVFRTTHSLKGVAGMFGFDDLSAVSHAMETTLEGLRRGDRSLSAELLDRLHRGLETMHRLRVEAAAMPGEGLRAEAAAAIRALEELRPDDPSAAGSSDSEAGPLAALWPRLEEAARRALRDSARAGRTVAVVVATGEPDGAENLARELTAAIRSWGGVHGALVGEDPAEAGLVQLVVSGSESLFQLMKVVGPLGGEVFEADPSVEGRNPPPAAGSAVPPGALPDAAGPDAAATGEATAPRPPARRPRETLRVPVDRVDRLLSELGDLVQAQLGLEVSSRGILDWVPDRMRRTLFRQSLRTVDRRIRALREEILRIRMVSLGPLFQRLERTVRETARTTGKEARLVTSGDGEELDKQVVEALTQPLVHLVRNAVDHGLEDPATRAAAGKDLPGTVRIAARPEGSHTVLEISDDGSGIDWERVRTKAIERGFLPPDSRPGRDVLQDLLFRPGFSLRDDVTEISGRGVGLDAVRVSVTRLGGLLDVRSDDAGTSFRLRIPTTLSVTRSLLVEAGGEAFFVPLSCVSRVDRIRVDRIECLDGEEVVLLDERVVPVVDLGAALGLGPISRLRERIPAVELGIADRRRLLLVDRLAGQREIVVRSLGDVLPSVPGIAGSTELGDGRTVLILDPAALLEPPPSRSVPSGGAP